MKEFPAAVPEIPVTDMDQALHYYEHKLGFDIDWGGADGGIAGISKDTAGCFLRIVPSVRIMVTLRR